MQLQQAFLLTFSSWLLVGIFAALPLYFGSLRLSVVDGLFETISVITTTGATVITIVAGTVGWAVFAFWLHGWLFGVRPFG